jgi:TfoX/Sxy family transcriptional regulator of competence genes
MAYDARLAERVRRLLARRKGITEKKMFGGIAFLFHGHMFCGILNDDLVVRVGPQRYEKASSRAPDGFYRMAVQRIRLRGVQWDENERHACQVDWCSDRFCFVSTTAVMAKAVVGFFYVLRVDKNVYQQTFF